MQSEPINVLMLFHRPRPVDHNRYQKLGNQRWESRDLCCTPWRPEAGTSDRGGCFATRRRTCRYLDYGGIGKVETENAEQVRESFKIYPEGACWRYPNERRKQTLLPIKLTCIT